MKRKLGEKSTEMEVTKIWGESKRGETGDEKGLRIKEQLRCQPGSQVAFSKEIGCLLLYFISH